MKKFLIEIMPIHLRDSHKQARNWGVYPQNGAERHICNQYELPDPDDEYEHVVRELHDDEVFTILNEDI